MAGRCVHLPSVLSREQAATLFESLQQLPWRREVDEFGPQARRTFYCGNEQCDFHFCGLQLRPHAWPPQLMSVRSAVEAACGVPPGSLTACLANDYPAGDGLIPWHHDEVRAHGELRAVASLSLGAPRCFRVRRRCGHSMQDGGGEGGNAGGMDIAARGAEEQRLAAAAGQQIIADTQGVAEVEKVEPYARGSMQGGGEGGSAGRSDVAVRGTEGQRLGSSALACQLIADAQGVAEIELHAGDVFLMTGDCQDYLEHELRLRHGDGHRISLTFRSIVPGFEEARRSACRS